MLSIASNFKPFSCYSMEEFRLEKPSKILESNHPQALPRPPPMSPGATSRSLKPQQGWGPHRCCSSAQIPTFSLGCLHIPLDVWIKNSNKLYLLPRRTRKTKHREAPPACTSSGWCPGIPGKRRWLLGARPPEGPPPPGHCRSPG